MVIKDSGNVINALSIDFDVFSDMTQFMPGAMQCEWDWVIEYSRWEGDFVHGFKFDYIAFEEVKDFLRRQKQKVYIAEDHKKLYDIVPADSVVRLVNLDFHEDAAVCKPADKIDCGNWISALRQYKRCSIKVDWRQLHTKGQFDQSRRDDKLEVNHSIGFKDIFNKAYDLIFLCQSYMYSPAHMNHRFRELIEVCFEPEIFKDSEPIYESYTERLAYASTYDRAYSPTGKETPEQMDKIYDDHEICVIYPVTQISNLKDCDPLYRR